MTSERCLKWDVQFNKCEECEEGYLGLNCTMECRYPSYGKDCQTACNCPQSYCSFIHGCEAGSPTLSTKTQDTFNGFTSTISRKTNPTINVCPTGYQGNTCELKCRYPSYGDGCQSRCICQEDYCYHDTGCNMSYDNCRRYPPERRNALLNSIILLAVWAVIQFTVYLYLSFFYKT
ncbi:protein draper-like isoform X2 [Saccostrea cucullata]|uniref:protein draper-like isoform X2 n=1 Tax=Saccostrea cuccullata TaxID=36930 RepID=UPI002ED0B5A8